VTKATPKDVIEEMQTIFQENISDPNPDRKSSGNKFVFTIPINFDLAQYPRIHIQNISSTHSGLSVGSTERFQRHRVQVSIFQGVSRGNRMDVDGDSETEAPNRVTDFIADRVIKEINDNQSRFRSLGTEDNVHSVLTLEENRVQDDQNQVIQHDIDARVKMSR